MIRSFIIHVVVIGGSVGEREGGGGERERERRRTLRCLKSDKVRGKVKRRW